MKFLSFRPAALLLAGSLVLSSCIGTFRLSNRLLSWNEDIGGRFVNELVFLSFWVLPVYELTFLSDLLVVNSIEFWSGKNPIAEGGIERVEGETGSYLVKRTRYGYRITDERTKKVTRLRFDEENRAWSAETGDREVFEFLRFREDGTVEIVLGDGRTVAAEPSTVGVSAFEALLGESATEVAAK